MWLRWLKWKAIIILTYMRRVGERADGVCLLQGRLHAFCPPLTDLHPRDLLRPHPCRYCGRSFKRKDHRVEHERIHTGERPYQCRVCARAFVQKQQVVGHIRRIHGITGDIIPLIQDTSSSHHRAFNSDSTTNLFNESGSNLPSHHMEVLESDVSGESYLQGSSRHLSPAPLAQLSALASAPRLTRPH